MTQELQQIFNLGIKKGQLIIAKYFMDTGDIGTARKIKELIMVEGAAEKCNLCGEEIENELAVDGRLVCKSCHKEIMEME